ncbi:hypothetical protein M3Y94_00357500 [Aphelenchoides besseyi]|nr:hypothetical protein M3Y94_00357500 [Aphelenchoides besseyi]
MEEEQTEKSKKEKWSCSLCTYNNIAGQLKCDLCKTPRFGQDDSDNETIKQQEELMAPSWSCGRCTFKNIQTAKRCAKCDSERTSTLKSDGVIERAANLAPRNLTIRANSPRIDRISSLKSHGGAPQIRHDSNVNSNTTNKWKCPRCTYLNFAKAVKCTMCCLTLPSSIRPATQPVRIVKDYYKPTPLVLPPDFHKRYRPFTIWCDGCYDIIHFGHANQLRQAKQFGNRLVVGIYSDQDIAKHKGLPVFNEQERCRLLRGIKWVDQIVQNAPFLTTVDTLDKYNCDFCVHSDNPSFSVDGEDTNSEVKAAGRFREVQRTLGVSATEIVGRMLLLTKSHHSHTDEFSQEHIELARMLSTCRETKSPSTRISRFVSKSNQFIRFAEGRPIASNDVVIYVAGAFDLFHVGHLAFLEAARKLGDYLIVGLYNDQDVNYYKGGNYPIMSLHERVLTILAYRPVDEVIIGAPLDLTDDMIQRFSISLVINGVRSGHSDLTFDYGDERFSVAKRRGIFRQINSNSDMTTEKIIERIIDNRNCLLRSRCSQQTASMN